jgi:hypothetical protein
MERRRPRSALRSRPCHKFPKDAFVNHQRTKASFALFPWHVAESLPFPRGQVYRLVATEQLRGTCVVATRRCTFWNGARSHVHTRTYLESSS